MSFQKDGPIAGVQVQDGFYDFESYVTLNRWISYWYQVRAILKYRPHSVLEVGCGTGATTEMLRRLGIKVTTLDFDRGLSPDIVGDIAEVDSLFGPGEFDMVCAFQVLEHLPFERFQPTLAKLARVARSHVLLSLPHWGYPVEIKARLLKNRFSLNLSRKVSRYPRWKFDGQHHWELGTRGYSRRRVSKVIAQELDVLAEYFCEGYSYHYFYETRVPHSGK